MPDHIHERVLDGFVNKKIKIGKVIIFDNTFVMKI